MARSKGEKISLIIWISSMIYLVVGLLILGFLVQPNEPIDRLYYQFWRLYSPNTAVMSNLFAIIVLLPGLAIMVLGFIILYKSQRILRNKRLIISI
jgi:hypothetical protein